MFSDFLNRLGLHASLSLPPTHTAYHNTHNISHTHIITHTTQHTHRDTSHTHTHYVSCKLCDETLAGKVFGTQMRKVPLFFLVLNMDNRISLCLPWDMAVLRASSYSFPSPGKTPFSLACASVCSGLRAWPAGTLAMGVRFLGSETRSDGVAPAPV